MIYKEINKDEVKAVYQQLVGNQKIESIYQACEQFGPNSDDIRTYDVYKIKTSHGIQILKKGSQREIDNYQTYLQNQRFNVPKFYGSYQDWLLIEYIEGDDCRIVSDQDITCVAKSLTQIQQTYWNHTATPRFDEYLCRLQKRSEFIKSYPELTKAYQAFIERQLSCPKTLSHGDLLPFNIIKNHDQVVFVDWGFGGIMPYTLDIARFIGHASETGESFPFIMTPQQKENFLNQVYESLKDFIDYQQYRLDIQLALLNEYIEFIEADEDDTHWYLNQALTLVKNI